MMVETVPRFAIGLPLLILPIFLIIGLFIFAVVKFGKDKPAVIPLCVAGFIAAILGSVFFLRMGFMFLPVFLIPGLIILGLIVFAVIKSGKGKGLLVVLGVLGVIAVVMVFHLFSVSVQHAPQPVRMQTSRDGTRRVEPIRVQTARVTSEPAIWHPGVEKEFLADVYPSRRAAVLALGRQVAETVIQSSLADAQMSREIGLLQDDHDRGLLAELARQIERSSTYESITCRVLQNIGSSEWDADSDNSVTQLKLWVRLVFDDIKTVRPSWSGDSSTKVAAGRASLKVKSPEGISSAEVRFAEKPWVESFPDFLSSNPSRQLGLARSGDSCISRQEAHQQAVADAMMRISQMLRSVQKNPSIVPANMAVSENDLSSGGFIVDRFTQRFSGLAGPIWREAILIDTSENRLSQLAQQKIRFSRAKRFIWARTGGTLIGMFALICVVYLFLNAATRGYYAWSLRITLMVVLGIGVFLFLILS